MLLSMSKAALVMHAWAPGRFSIPQNLTAARFYFMRAGFRNQYKWSNLQIRGVQKEGASFTSDCSKAKCCV